MSSDMCDRGRNAFMPRTVHITHDAPTTLSWEPLLIGLRLFGLSHMRASKIIISSDGEAF